MSDLFSDLDDEFSLSVAPKKSGLGSLFGSSPKTERVSPKPSPQASPVPKRKAEPEKPAPAAAPAQPNRPTVVYAIPGVICHKYNTSKSDYDLIGKIGVAILGLPQLNSFQMLLYRGNNDHVAQIPLHPEFHFAIQNELFASFADSQRQNWSIKFPSVEIISLFSMHLAIVKATMGKKEDSVTTQDIVVGSGNPINTEDQIKLTYSAHIVQSDCTVGKLFDSNLASDKPLRMTVGNHGKTVRGLHQGVKGMAPGGKRIIVIPSSLGYGATGLSGRVPPNSTIVYQVELVAVKNQDEPEPEAKQESVVISDVDDNEGKNPVMDRVKKFGVSMTGAVPNFDKPKEAAQAQAQAQPAASAPAANASAQPAAKEEQRAAPAQEQSHTQAQVQAQAQAQPAASAPASSADQQLALLQSQIQMLMQMQMQAAAAAAAPPAATEAVKQKEEPAAVKTEKKEEIVEEEEDVDTVPYSNADNMKFLHDTRMIHEEIKASVVSAATKIETLQRDIKNSIFGRDDEVSKEKMSGTVLIQTITQYVEQNEQLQQEVIKKGERIDELREKTARILEKNKLLIEEHTNTMEERNNALTENTEQSRKLINALRDEKLDIEEKLHSSTEELSAIRSNLSKLNHTNANLSEHLSTMKGEILRLKTEASSIQATKLNEDSELNELRSSLRDEQAERKRLEEQLEKLEEELNDAKTTLTKFREGMEERKQKWIQIKSQMDKAHEDEKLAAMKQMKAQLLKLKKEKDEAVEEAENIEHNIERRWRENIGRLKIQFKERVDELQQDFSDDKERELNAAITEAQDLAKRQLKETKQSIVEQYKAGFKASRYEQLSAESSSKIQEREKQLEAAFKARKEYMASMIKKIMGGMFYSIREDIEQEEEYQGGDILVTLVDAIRQATMDGMQNVKTYFEEHSSTASMIENEVAGVVAEDEIVEDELIEDVSPEVSEGVISDDELIEDAAPEDDLVEDDLVEDEDLQEDHTEEKRDEPAEESDDEEFSALLSQPKKTDVDFEDLLDAEPDVIADELADEPVDDVNDEPVDDEPVDDEPIDDEPVAEVEDVESVEASEPEESEKDAEDKPETEDTPESDEASPAADATAPDSDDDESEGGQGESDVETPAEEPEPEPEPEVDSEPDEPAMEEENTPEEKEEPVQLPDTAFSSNPFGAKPKANTFKSDDIFSPKKTSTSTPKAATTFTTDDIFGGSSSSTKSKKVDDFDDMFGFSSPEQTKKAATPKKETSPSQPPDLFGMDITKGKGSAGLFTPKKQGGLGDIFGSGSKPAATKSAAKSTDKKSTGLDDIFSF